MINAARVACINSLHEKLPQRFFTQKETEKIYNHNFDVLVIAKTIDSLQSAGHDWLNGFSSTRDNWGRKSINLPVPANYAQTGHISDEGTAVSGS